MNRSRYVVLKARRPDPVGPAYVSSEFGSKEQAEEEAERLAKADAQRTDETSAYYVAHLTGIAFTRLEADKDFIA